MKQILLSLSSLVLVLGCSSDSADIDPDTGLVIVEQRIATEAQKRSFEPLAAMADSKLTDFNFSPHPDYVELRMLDINSTPEDTDTSQFDIRQELDLSTKLQLTETQLFNLNTTTSAHGYSGGCFPANCVFYLVALTGEEILLVDNKNDLSLFLGTIDRPSELHFVLDGRRAQYIKAVSDGYQALTIWQGCAGEEKIELLHIDIIGNVTILDVLLEQNNGTVC